MTTRTRTRASSTTVMNRMCLHELLLKSSGPTEILQQQQPQQRLLLLLRSQTQQQQRSSSSTSFNGNATNTSYKANANMAEIATTPTSSLAHQLQQQHETTIHNSFFSSSSNGNGEKGSELDSGEEPSPSPGTASITFAETDEEYVSSPSSDGDKTKKIKFDSSLYTVPIVIEMPPMDDVGGDESHCFVETWHKRKGQRVYRNDVLCDISTPDFVFGMQIDDEEIGVMGEIHVEEGVKVPDHTPICTIYHKPTEDEEGQEQEQKQGKVL